MTEEKYSSKRISPPKRINPLKRSGLQKSRSSPHRMDRPRGVFVVFRKCGAPKHGADADFGDTRGCERVGGHHR
jgi:hypothetical protein